MAVKEKNVEKKSRLLEILSKEYKWEIYLYFFISLFGVILGTLILCGTLSVKTDFPVIGKFPKVFSGILVGASAIGLIYSLFPFFKPAWPEMKKVSWPTGKNFLADAARVFMFLIVFALLFVLYDLFITEIWSLIVK